MTETEQNESFLCKEDKNSRFHTYLKPFIAGLIACILGLSLFSAVIWFYITTLVPLPEQTWAFAFSLLSVLAGLSIIIYIRAHKKYFNFDAFMVCALLIVILPLALFYKYDMIPKDLITLVVLGIVIIFILIALVVIFIAGLAVIWF